MLKNRLFYLHLILLTFFLPFINLKAADDVSGGKVIFEDEVEKATTKTDNKKEDAKAPKQVSGGVVKKDKPTNLSNSEAQVDSTREDIKINLKKNQADSILDQKTMFKPNQERNFYGINVLVLRINVKRDKAGKVLGLLPENQDQPKSYINEKNSPEYYLNIEMNSYREKDYFKSNLYESHKNLLRSFVKKIPRSEDAIVLMYINGSNLKTYSDKAMELEKTIYAQYVTDFLYRNKRKLIIEKRYVDDIPEDEIFLVISKYKGNIPQNIYNSSKGNSLQWLARYKEIERQNIVNANKSRNDLEKSIDSTTKNKDTFFLTTPVDRQVKEDKPFLKINKDNLFKEDNTRRVTPKDMASSNYTGPRRIIDKAEEEASNANSEVTNEEDKNQTSTTEGANNPKDVKNNETSANAEANTTQGNGNTVASEGQAGSANTSSANTASPSTNAENKSSESSTNTNSSSLESSSSNTPTSTTNEPNNNMESNNSTSENNNSATASQMGGTAVIPQPNTPQVEVQANSQ